jgi:hypothetical protein
MNLIWKRQKANKKMSRGRFKIDESWVKSPADRGSFDQNSVDRNCHFSVDQKF